MPDKKYCRGCRNDFYNGPNDLGVKECWQFKTAKAVTRYRIGWWTRRIRPEDFEKVTTHDCHHAPGHYLHYEQLPEHLRTP